MYLSCLSFRCIAIGLCRESAQAAEPGRIFVQRQSACELNECECQGAECGGLLSSVGLCLVAFYSALSKPLYLLSPRRLQPTQVRGTPMGLHSVLWVKYRSRFSSSSTSLLRSVLFAHIAWWLVLCKVPGSCTECYSLLGNSDSGHCSIRPDHSGSLAAWPTAATSFHVGEPQSFSNQWADVGSVFASDESNDIQCKPFAGHGLR